MGEQYFQLKSKGYYVLTEGSSNVLIRAAPKGRVHRDFGIDFFTGFMGKAKAQYRLFAIRDFPNRSFNLNLPNLFTHRLIIPFKKITACSNSLS